MKKNWSRLCILGIVLLLTPALAYGEDPVLSLKEQIIDIQNQGELGFRNFTLCSKIIGFGQYVPTADNKVKAGSKIFFYFEPVNLFTNRREGTYQIWLTQDMIVLTEDGKELYNGPEAVNYNYQGASPIMDVFAQNSLSLGNLPPGVYQFKAVLHDKLKEVDASYVFTFEVVP